MSAEDFARSCREAAHDLRRLPAEVARALDQRLGREVAEPLAADLRDAGRNVYGRRVAATTTVRLSATPELVIGGPQRILSGGATGRDMVHAVLEGVDPNRVATIPAGAGPTGRHHRAFRRRTTRALAGRQDPFLSRTMAARLDHYADVAAHIVTAAAEKVTGRA